MRFPCEYRLKKWLKATITEAVQQELQGQAPGVTSSHKASPQINTHASDPLSPLLKALKEEPSLEPYAAYLRLKGTAPDSLQRGLISEISWLSAQLGRWEVLLRLHKEISARCLQDQSPLSALEQQLLEASLLLNCTDFERTNSHALPTLFSPQEGATFQSSEHSAADAGHFNVASCLTPGLKNSLGRVEAKALVLTR